MATVKLRYAHDHGVVRVSGDLGRGAVHELVRSAHVLVGEAYVARQDPGFKRRELEPFALAPEGTWGPVSLLAGPPEPEGLS